MSPVLADGFSTTGPPGKSSFQYLDLAYEFRRNCKQDLSRNISKGVLGRSCGVDWREETGRGKDES